MITVITMISVPSFSSRVFCFCNDNTTINGTTATIILSRDPSSGTYEWIAAVLSLNLAQIRPFCEPGDGSLRPPIAPPRANRPAHPPRPPQNEERNVGAAVRSVLDVPPDQRGDVEVIVVDADSRDATVREARRAGASVLRASTPGRAPQMNQGARAARGNVLLFLHADSTLPSGYIQHVDASLKRRDAQWGCFRSIDTGLRNPLASFLINRAVALRTKLLHKPYGDQCIFVTRKTFNDLGGYADLPLLEDVDLASRLATHTHAGPAIVPLDLKTSGRRWETLGVIRTTLLNQYILLRHAMGADIHHLASLYGRRRA